MNVECRTYLGLCGPAPHRGGGGGKRGGRGWNETQGESKVFSWIELQNVTILLPPVRTF